MKIEKVKNEIVIRLEEGTEKRRCEAEIFLSVLNAAKKSLRHQLGVFFEFADNLSAQVDSHLTREIRIPKKNTVN